MIELEECIQGRPYPIKNNLHLILTGKVSVMINDINLNALDDHTKMFYWDGRLGQSSPAEASVIKTILNKYNGSNPDNPDPLPTVIVKENADEYLQGLAKRYNENMLEIEKSFRTGEQCISIQYIAKMLAEIKIFGYVIQETGEMHGQVVISSSRSWGKEDTIKVLNYMLKHT